MTLPCPHCGVDVQIEMTELGRTEEIGPTGSAVHRATHRIIAGATHASPVCASFDFAAWFSDEPGGDAQILAKPRPKSAPEDPGSIIPPDSSRSNLRSGSPAVSGVAGDTSMGWGCPSRP
jgi:hypothetical protein